MTLFTEPSRIIITCNKRLLPYLQQEVRELGFRQEDSGPTHLELYGSLNDCIRLNLNLRCASQVLYSLKTFRAQHPEHVYAQVLSLPWEDIIPEDGYLAVTSTVNHPSVNNNLFMNLKVKDAVTDRIRDVSDTRPDSGPLLDRTVLHLFWQDEYAELFIDTSGETLAKHGYRKLPGKAPMLEALAAATVLATRWDGTTPFVNPMCGSGTVAIEAVLLATQRQPGLLRSNYAFMHLKGYDETVYRQECRQLEAKIKTIPGLRVIATDLSADAIEIAKSNAAEAGVEDLIEFAVGDFAATHIPAEPGVIYFNPEYGERMGDSKELEATYARIGDFMKKECKGYRGYIFTGNLELAKKIGLKASRRLEFYSAKFDCRLLEYELYQGTRRTNVAVPSVDHS